MNLLEKTFKDAGWLSEDNNIARRLIILFSGKKSTITASLYENIKSINWGEWRN